MFFSEGCVVHGDMGVPCRARQGVPSNKCARLIFCCS